MLRKSKIALIIALITMMGIFFCLVIIECQPTEVPFYLEVNSENGAEQYACWRGPNQQCYVFLPRYVDFSKTRIVMNTDDTLYLDGKILNRDTDCASLQEDHVYQLTYRGVFEEQHLNLMFVRAGKNPVIHIDTESGEMDYIHGKKGNEEKGNIRIYSPEGVLLCSDALKSIAVRGNSTFDEVKKPYIIKFTEPEDILGMGAANKWILLANAFDLTNLRNQIVMQSAKKMGMPYTPDMQWVELYLNQEYVGLYLISEKIEVDENRVAITQQGSYLFSLEDRGRIITQNLPHYETTAGQVIRIRYPEVLDESNNKTIASIVQQAENAILSDDGVDPGSGVAWDELIDVDSWARKYLVEEIFANLDAGKWSQYFYVDGNDEKIYAGPVWDYDLSMAISWQTTMPNIWYCSRLTAGGDVIAPWFEALSRKPVFMQRVKEIYGKEVLPLMQELINVEIDQEAEYVAYSSAINALRWSGGEKPEREVWRIKQYLQERISFLNDIWLEETEYTTVKAYLGAKDGYVHFLVPVGSFMDDLPALQNDDFLGWYWSVDAMPVKPDQKVVSDVQIYAVRNEDYQQSKQILKLMPLGMIAILGIVIAIIEICRLKSKRWHKYG